MALGKLHQNVPEEGAASTDYYLVDLKPPVVPTHQSDVTELLVLLQVLECLRGAVGEALPGEVVGGYLHYESQTHTN